MEATITRKKTVTPTTIAGHTVPNPGTGTLAMITKRNPGNDSAIDHADDRLTNPILFSRSGI